MTSHGENAINPNPSSVKALLTWARKQLKESGCDSPALDAELLLAHILHTDRIRLIIESDRILTQPQTEVFKALIDRRAGREPLPYILGEWEFYGLMLEVSPAVLIPRPETETLVEACLSRLNLDAPNLLGSEVGAGSGAVSIALAHNLLKLQIIATESSPSALEVARRNLARHNLTDRVQILTGDLLSPLEGKTNPTSLDFIAANLPYIPTAAIDTLSPEVSRWEPPTALDGGADGLQAIRRLIAQAPRWLKSGGFLALEISPEQAETVLHLLTEQGFSNCQALPDLARRPRVAVGTT